MTYFNNCQNLDQLRSAYRELAKQYHPDINPDISDDIMKLINNEYDFATAKLLKGTQDESVNFEAAMQFKEKIASIVNLPDVLIEIVGSWIWVTGETRRVKEELKAADFNWAHKKQAWYWHPEGFGGGRGKKSLDEIRVIYGSQIIRNNRFNQISA